MEKHDRDHVIETVTKALFCPVDLRMDNNIEKGSREEWEYRAKYLNRLDHSCSEGLPVELNNLFLKAETGFEAEIMTNLNGKIIEIGSGLGRWTEKLIAHGKNVFLFDIAFNAIKSNKDITGKPAICCSIENMAFRSQSFDGALLVNVLIALKGENIKKESSKEISRVLKKGGTLVFIEMFIPRALKSIYLKISEREPLTSKNITLLFSDFTLIKKKTGGIFLSIFGGTIVWELTKSKTIIKCILPMLILFDKFIFYIFSAYSLYIYTKN